MPYTMEDYKIGDRVQVVSERPHDHLDWPQFTEEMCRCCGSWGTVDHLDSMGGRSSICVHFDGVYGRYWNFLPHWLIPAQKPKPVVPKVLARTFAEYLKDTKVL